MEVLIAAPAKCEVRAVIRFLHTRKLPSMEIHWQLTEVYDEECMSIQHIRKWCRAFAEGRTEVHDEEQSGRPPVLGAIVQKINSEPDLAPNNYHLLLKLNEHLVGKCFKSDNEVRAEVTCFHNRLVGDYFDSGI